MKQLKVKFDARGMLIPINISDLPRTFWENSEEIQRIMIIEGNKGQIRGKHAHHKTHQCLIGVKGIVQLQITEDGENAETHLLQCGELFYHPAKEWLEMKFITDGLIISLCSTEHDEKDYIKSLDEFQKLVKNGWE